MANIHWKTYQRKSKKVPGKTFGTHGDKYEQALCGYQSTHPNRDCKPIDIVVLSTITSNTFKKVRAKTLAIVIIALALTIKGMEQEPGRDPGNMNFIKLQQIATRGIRMFM